MLALLCAGMALNDCLIAHYTLDAHALDVTGNGYNGVPIDVIPTTDRNGTPDGAYRFDGSTSHIVLNDNQPIILQTEFTIMAWARMQGPAGGIQSNSQIFVQRNDDVNTTSAIGLQAENGLTGDAIFAVRTTGNPTEFVSFLSAGYGTWNHYAGVCTGDSLLFYLNGTLMASAPFTQANGELTDVNYVEIGRQRFKNDIQGVFHGAIGDVRIYDCALTAEQVRLFGETAEIVFNPLPDTLYLCDEALAIPGQFQDQPVLWSNGTVDTIITVTEPGVYTAEVTIADCRFVDSVLVIDARMMIPSMITDSICAQSQTVLESPLEGQFQWSTGESAFQIVVPSGMYQLTVTDACGPHVIDFDIRAVPCNDCKVYIPNIFSPNQDGVNDLFAPSLQCPETQLISFDIFNRWGEHVFASTHFANQWDGTFNGERLPTGVYTWILHYTYPQMGQAVQVTQSGDVTLIR